MSSRRTTVDRRNFLRGAGGSLAASALPASSTYSAEAQTEIGQQATPEPLTHAGVFRPLTDTEKVTRIAANSYPLRWIFKTRGNVGERETVASMKAKYGELNFLEYPEFTKKTFPGVTKMDMWSSLFGDPGDDSQYVKVNVMSMQGKPRETQEFDPSTTNSKKWLAKMANAQAKAGVYCHHISNNAPRDICDLDPAKRKTGVEVAKKWLDGAAILGAKSMRVNSGGPRIAPTPEANDTGYPKNPQI